MTTAAETHDRIMEVARKNFACNGYLGTSMDSIVKGTGLSKGAIYWHFKGKKELFRAVLEKETEMILANLIPERGVPTSGVLEFFLDWGDKYLEMIWGDRELKLLWLELFIESQRCGAEDCDLSNMASEILETVHRKIRIILAGIFPGLGGGKEGLPLADLINVAEFLFDALIVSLGVRADLEKAKSYWRFLISRMIEGGKSYVS